MPGRTALVLGCAAWVLLLGCGRPAGRDRAQAAEVAATDTSPSVPSGAAALREAARPSRQPRLSPLADSIAGFLVFAPVGETVFVAAARNRRLLVDVGRVDIEVRRDSARALAYREAVEKRGTVPVGTRFRLRGPWGAEDAVATAVDTWNGRIVLRLSGARTADSLARRGTPVIASAFRTDSTREPAPDTCARATPEPILLRVAAVRDSLEMVLRAEPGPPYDRLQRSIRFTSSSAAGCFFGTGRVVLAATLAAGGAEWVRERVVLVDEVGGLTPLHVSDLRFRAHELLSAFDADGDGVDDVATRATTERAGATTLLRLDPVARRLVRTAAGFAWEQ